ncbi:MAG: TdeIII family type II restriction endonuclease [Candidatus Paceibacterota bacterium]|jgi:hypothetical protein
MKLTADQKNRVSEEVKKILSSRLKSFPDLSAQNRNAPFHDAVLECFKEKFRGLNIETPRLVAIASWLHGLSTSLGTGFENFGNILSGGYKRKFTGPYTLKVKKSQSLVIDEIIRGLKSSQIKPDLKQENSRIFKFSDTEDSVEALGFTADIFIEKKNEIVAVEMKSVRPNAGEGRGEKQKILYGKAALKLLYPKHDVKFFVGFPFDPTAIKPTDYDKKRFFDYLVEFKKYFAEDEVMIADELWDYLSGSKQTMDQILEVIRETIAIVSKK